MFKLANDFGGRERVLDLTVAEAFLFLGMKMKAAEQEAEKEQERYWMNFLVNVFSQPAQEGESHAFKQERERFLDALRPRVPHEEKQEPRKQYGWHIPEEILEEGRKQKEREAQKQPLLVMDAEKGD